MLIDPASLPNGSDHSHVVGGKLRIDAHAELHLRCGASEIVMLPDGVITIKGVKLNIEEDEAVKITAARIDLN